MKLFIVVLILLSSVSCGDNLQYSLRSPSQGSGDTDPGDGSNPDGNQGGSGDDGSVSGPDPIKVPIDQGDILSISTTVTKRYLVEADSIDFSVKFSSDVTISGSAPELVFRDMTDGLSVVQQLT